MKPDQPWLNLNGIIYSFEQLKARDFRDNVNPFEQNTLHFCHDWLNGQQEFQIPTSGSTGTPKTIILARKQMEASALLTIKALHLKTGYTSLVCLDTKYIGGKMMLVRSLVLGMNMIAVDPSSNPLAETTENQSIDFAALVPYQLQVILNSTFKARLNNLKCVIIGGAPLHTTSERELQLFTCKFYATYGMTETISHVALRQLNGEQRQDYFQVLEGIEIAQDERDCLVIRADYLGDDKIITNDIISIIDADKFRWLGRWDNVINTGGVKVMPEKVESAIQKIFDALKLSNRFFVTGLPDEKLNQKVTLIVEGAPFLNDPLSSLQKQLEREIDRFHRPREIKFVSHFKETETGKLQRAETLRLIPASSHEYET